MAKSRANCFNKGFVGAGAQLMRHEGRKPPTLSLCVELVRRRANANPLREVVLRSPGIRSVRINTDGKILHQRKMLSALGKLDIELPLYPFIKAYAALMIAGKLLNFRLSRMPVLVGPAMPARLLLLRESAKNSKAMKAFTALTAECIKCAIACEMEPERLKYTHFEREYPITINEAIAVKLAAGANRFIQMWNCFGVNSREGLDMQPKWI